MTITMRNTTAALGTDIILQKTVEGFGVRIVSSNVSPAIVFAGLFRL